MSAILGVLSSTPRADPDPSVDAMLDRMARRGHDRREVWAGDGVSLAVSRYSWELESDFSGRILLLVEPDLVVAADATILYREDLVRRLSAESVSPTGNTSSHLIAAAYRAWGEQCTSRLEGDFAFILWDRRSRRAVCSRDFLAKRPLYYAETQSSLVIASTIGGVVEHHSVPDDLDLASIGAAAAGMNAAGPETCYRAIRPLPAASDLNWEPGRLSGPIRHWEPRLVVDRSLSFEQAGEQLRDLLMEAVRERLAGGGPSTVWMSGGWDSPAVFAVGQAHLADIPSEHPLTPVSISYPPGDPGREDELITEIAARWKSPVHWIDINTIPLFDSAAGPTDEPFRHLYEHWNRALARGTRSSGSRVALDGNGGDQVFQVSPIYLADLFRSGRWIELHRDWRALGGRGFRPFFQTAIQPNLPDSLLRAAAILRGGRRLHHYVERWTPDWFAPEFLRSSGIVEREFTHLPDRAGARAEAECAWYWKSPFFHRIMAHLAGFALEHGVELRSPLADRRVVEFGLSRPRRERASGAETKRLLRHAMKGLLPESALASRTTRTGTTNGFSHREMTTWFPLLLDELLAEPMKLEELGIVSAEGFRQAASRYRYRNQAELRVALFYTYQTERWLRARNPKAVRGPRNSATSFAKRRLVKSQ